MAEIKLAAEFLLSSCSIEVQLTISCGVFKLLLFSQFCRRLHAPQPCGRNWMQLCRQGAGIRGLQGHADGLYIAEE